ncbi:metastasis-associated protein MTA1-like isoform X2 [Scleropages formosus]|nr:metastasis-associated protein MTA1-like isoform X2 [Scleropages formosus]
MAANMYRVGDYVYFENSSSNPFLIRRIEELNKTVNGNVEAKVLCFYRRRDISSALVALADKHAREMEQEMENLDLLSLPEQQKHQLRHRELFLSRQLESLPATHIRGKCSVTLLNETEILTSYLDREDSFFYSLVYDPQQRTLLADKGEIRVGSKYQAEVADSLVDEVDQDRDQSKLEEKVWDPSSTLTDKQIDQFLVVARSVGTFARALDSSSAARQPSLHMSAASASRDITLFHAMDVLHKTGYDISRALSALVPHGGPVLCRDEMEEWSPSEARRFEEALEKYGKDFADIRQDCLPWKSLTSIVEFYYMWKTTDRYVQQKRLKAAEAESKLKQVYIPIYNKPNPNRLSGAGGKTSLVNGSGVVSNPLGQAVDLSRPCESCHAAASSQWYSWGPSLMQCRLCAPCWVYWRKYGGLKMSTRLDGDRPGPSSMSPHSQLERFGSNPKFAPKTRQGFYMQTSQLTRAARRACHEMLRPRHLARNPYTPLTAVAARAKCAARWQEVARNSLPLKPVVRKPLESVIRYLVTHPRLQKPRAPRNSTQCTENQVPVKTTPTLNNSSPTILGRRSYEHHNGLDGKPNHGQTRQMVASVKPRGIFGRACQKGHLTQKSFQPPIKRQRPSLTNPCGDLCFLAKRGTSRHIKRLLPIAQMRRAARRPHQPISVLPLQPGSSLRAPVNEEPIVIDD